MTAFFQKINQSIAMLLLAVLLGGLIFVPFSVEATVPTIDFTLIGKAVLQLAELVFQSGQLSALVVKEYVLDPAVKLLASFLLQAITKAIIRWIQGGGNTNFVSNLEAALIDAADKAAGEFLNMLAGANLCSPFANPLRNAFRRPRLTLSERLSCRVTDIFRNLNTTYEDFLKDFTKGGWLAYSGTVNYSGSNYIDAIINAYDEKLKRESRRAAIVQAKYQAGSGFLGVNVKKEVCDDFPEYETPICRTVDVQTTPGKLVGEQVAHVFNSGIDQAVNADEIGEAIDAIITALINKLIDSAQAGLLANDEHSGFLDARLLDLPPLPTLLPDFTISKNPAPTATSTALAGDIITFSGTVKNQGGGATTTSFTNRFQIDLNNDGTIDVTLNPNPIITNLLSGEEQKVISAIWKSVEGTHRVIVCADEPDDDIEELLETNNCNPGGTGIFTVGPRSDLIISENPSIFSGDPKPGSSVTFRGVIKNQGGSTATTTFENRFQIDVGNNGTIDTTLSPSPTIANLNGSASQGVVSSSWSAAEGTHRVILCADEPSRIIREADETNNCNPNGTGVFTISP